MSPLLQGGAIAEPQRGEAGLNPEVAFCAGTTWWRASTSGSVLDDSRVRT